MSSRKLWQMRQDESFDMGKGWAISGTDLGRPIARRYAWQRATDNRIELLATHQLGNCTDLPIKVLF